MEELQFTARMDGLNGTKYISPKFPLSDVKLDPIIRGDLDNIGKFNQTITKEGILDDQNILSSCGEIAQN
jgi:hypothetical protein